MMGRAGCCVGSFWGRQLEYVNSGRNATYLSVSNPSVEGPKRAEKVTKRKLHLLFCICIFYSLLALFHDSLGNNSDKSWLDPANKRAPRILWMQDVLTDGFTANLHLLVFVLRYGHISLSMGEIWLASALERAAQRIHYGVCVAATAKLTGYSRPSPYWLHDKTSITARTDSETDRQGAIVASESQGESLVEVSKRVS